MGMAAGVRIHHVSPSERLYKSCPVLGIVCGIQVSSSENRGDDIGDGEVASKIYNSPRNPSLTEWALSVVIILAILQGSEGEDAHSFFVILWTAKVINGKR